MKKLRQQIEVKKPAITTEGTAKLKVAKARRAELATILASLKAERETTHSPQQRAALDAALRLRFGAIWGGGWREMFGPPR